MDKNTQKDTQNEKARIGPTFDDVVRHVTRNGVVDLAALDALEGRYGTNGGRGCDVLRGPCSCGAWH
jgi:hypothetical protein